MLAGLLAMWRHALLALACVESVSAKAVFAHFMAENAATWNTSLWAADIALAQAAHIDAFALNIRVADPSLNGSLAAAFAAAEARSFSLFLSFDYAGNGAWPAADVQALLQTYMASAAYYRVDGGRPFVSTFEGTGNASDWIVIKEATGAYFVPDWSSLGAKLALELVPGVPDGLFSWAAWPWGPLSMNTSVDATYEAFLGDVTTEDMTYMMPVSPWFFTDLPGFDKNWVWNGDNLWFDRWQQVLSIDPDFVEILTWNDYGESHYIGPLHTSGNAMTAFEASEGNASFNYAAGMPHDAWRVLLPYLIDQYKFGNGSAADSGEGLVAWYRLASKDSPHCITGKTTGNTASQLQETFAPADVVEDKVFFTTVLVESRDPKVTVGGVSVEAEWTSTPADGVAGLYHGEAAWGNNTGAVVVTVGDLVMTGEAISAYCNFTIGQNGNQNWNAWVGEAVQVPGLDNGTSSGGDGNGSGSGSELGSANGTSDASNGGGVVAPSRGWVFGSVVVSVAMGVFMFGLDLI